jgi:hypothetical protein
MSNLSRGKEFFTSPKHPGPTEHPVQSVWSFLGAMRLVDGADHPHQLAPMLEKRRGVLLWFFMIWYLVNKDMTIWSWSRNRFFARPVASAPESQISVLACLSYACSLYTQKITCPRIIEKMHTKVWTERERNLYVLNPRHKRRLFRSWKYVGMWFEKVENYAQQKRLYHFKAEGTYLLHSTICSDSVTNLNMHVHATSLVILRTYKRIISVDYSQFWIGTVLRMTFI